MAGGPSTVELVVAATAAGAFGFLAGGYKTATSLADEMGAVRADGVASFGVNVFVPGAPAADAATTSSTVLPPPAMGETTSGVRARPRSRSQ